MNNTSSSLTPEGFSRTVNALRQRSMAMADSEYSDSGFWQKVKDFAKQAGREVIEKALWLYYAAQRPETPAWAKTIIFGALGYFITPVDAIPDLTPLLGFTDDLGALAAALTMVAVYIDEDTRAKAADKLDNWFGADKPTD